MYENVYRLSASAFQFMTTIREVAERAGVSLATVSRVLNGHPYVADDVRDRVLEAIEQLDYRPNRVAQRLRAARSQVVGAIFSDIVNPFYTLALTGMEQVFAAQRLSVLIGNSNINQEKEDDFIELMRTEEAAGLIIAPVREHSPTLAKAVREGLPVVIIDRRADSLAVDAVLADSFNGARAAIEHFIRLGHQRIGAINGPQHLTSGRERYAGYVAAMEAAALPVEPDWVRFGDYKQESGYRLVRELLSLPQPPTALFVANNLMTIGALNGIHEAGYNIPKDIAIIGFDDLSWALTINPPLTTVAQPTFDIGVCAAEMLLDRIENPGRPPRTEVLDTQLIVRASCGAASGTKQSS